MNEAQLIAATGLLGFALVFPGLIAVVMQGGLKLAIGNREAVGDLPEWAQRAGRAQRNMIDTLVPFLAIVIAIQMAGASNENTQFGAALFFWGRVAHAVSYISGIPYVRTLAFLVSANGMIAIAREVLPIASPSALISDLF